MLTQLQIDGCVVDRLRSRDDDTMTRSTFCSDCDQSAEWTHNAPFKIHQFDLARNEVFQNKQAVRLQSM